MGQGAHLCGPATQLGLPSSTLDHPLSSPWLRLCAHFCWVLQKARFMSPGRVYVWGLGLMMEQAHLCSRLPWTPEESSLVTGHHPVQLPCSCTGTQMQEQQLVQGHWVRRQTKQPGLFCLDWSLFLCSQAFQNLCPYQNLTGLCWAITSQACSPPRVEESCSGNLRPLFQSPLCSGPQAAWLGSIWPEFRAAPAMPTAVWWRQHCEKEKALVWGPETRLPLGDDSQVASDQLLSSRMRWPQNPLLLQHWSKLFDFSEPQILHLFNEDNTWAIGFLGTHVSIKWLGP